MPSAFIEEFFQSLCELSFVGSHIKRSVNGFCFSSSAEAFPGSLELCHIQPIVFSLKV